jgi:phenol 2-monooxygenase
MNQHATTLRTHRLAFANWFRGCNLRVRVLEKKSHLTSRGRAEGLKSTTVEIFESFGIGHRIRAELFRLEEIAIWSAEKSAEGVVVGARIEREQVLHDRVLELGKTRETLLQQCKQTVRPLLFFQSYPALPQYLLIFPFTSDG